MIELGHEEDGVTIETCSDVGIYGTALLFSFLRKTIHCV